ncbi:MULTISPECIES: tRNA (adenosine(37)-N6)-threonylcarbamoyltransferase complex dimerization subunit type 1 TsaB [Achromobacter]|uniref:[Ribosomal protein bS18]-alanine N-acetyltransferase n=1 Tax=Alcaligenes xylosoxydans xylosoxydans TaxID=85698 RepID=A0A424WI08_ALCXX|nr:MULTISPECIES: tRNA (adenosine(37)-N6)-threonylcarbamoyltransferase complex dimerization subunit type 1 TsaB [Achromobacter]MBC9903928.1 tRNA (adenosine(37)-N6)-threonylcarbamoyltransferase complex dimerization subunit type 1 TsaB [Achromobacter xylosoxidans]MBD0867047.1 tRNA (adenosine(37)-N6)-threonylcarbamoyltransferase complex dimerization subunit type 1 TsaB [Achromobacter xylosoxidans]QNP84603.1 tRNA (adenosine(37)-N6)-threonylcarbamoyltransferase complex dimerization subunit type 1 TsaB
MELNLLALETSSSRCGVALLRAVDGRLEVSVREHEGSQEHAERLLPMANELLAASGLAPAALHAVAFGQGPGGFTGLRVACGVAQGMGLGLGIPVVPIVSHQAVAAQVETTPAGAIVVALDARMNEVYLAVYRQANISDGEISWEVLQAPLLIAAAEVVPWTAHHLPAWSARAGLPLEPVLAGDAWDAYASEMEYPGAWRRADARRPEAASVARLGRQGWLRGEAVAPELAAPLYVRDKVAFTTAERMRGEGGNPKARPSLVPSVPQPMTDADLDEVVALEAHVQAFPWTRGNFADALAAGYGAWALRREGKLAGFCVLMFAPDVAHLLVIAVAKPLHRQGLGGLLLDWCEQQARERGMEGVLLEVRPSNESAISFYKRHGYLQIGVRRGYYPAEKGGREDALVMQKRFAADGAAA